MIKKRLLILAIFILIFTFSPFSVLAVRQSVEMKLGLLENGDGNKIYKNMTALPKVGIFFNNKTSTQIKEMKISRTGLFSSMPWKQYSAMVPWVFSAPDGQKPVYAQFKTYDGEIFSAAATFIYDTTPPDIQFKLISKSVGPDSMDVSYSVKGQDIWSSINYDCRIGLTSSLEDSIWVPCNSEKTKIRVDHYKNYANISDVPFFSSKDGQKIKVYFQAKDKVNNTTSILSDTFTLDKSPPEVYLNVPPSNSLSSEIEILAYDKYSSLGKMQLSNAPLDSNFHLIGEKIVEMPYKSKVRWNFDKKRVVSVRVWDSVGNKSEVYYAYLAPISPLTPLPSGKVLPTNKLLPTQSISPTVDPTIVSDPKYVKFQQKIKQLENKQKKLTKKINNAQKSIRKQKEKISFIEKTLKNITSFLKSLFVFWK